MGCHWSQHERKRAKQYQVSEGIDGRQEASENVLQLNIEGRKSAGSDADARVLVPKVGKTAAGELTSAAHHQQSVNGSATPSSTAAACKRIKLNPQDFTFTGLRYQTRVKQQGSVMGQQFIIDDCEGCDLYVLDQCASVTIDDCTNCRIFIGPTEASIFMRGCSNCSLAAVTRQMRCRDCSSCNLLLLCRTRPIIESSTGMVFGCFDAPYAGLAAQMAAAQLSAFHNFWSDVYDFTPAAAASQAATKSAADTSGSTSDGKAVVRQSTGPRNWRLLPPGTTVIDVLGLTRAPTLVQLALGMAQVSAVSERAAAATRQQQHSETVANDACAPPAAETTEHAAVNHAEELALATAEESTANEQHLSAPVPTAADRMCVIVSQGMTTSQAGSSCVGEENKAGSSGRDCHYMFVLFPANQSATALQWVHTHTLQGSNSIGALSFLGQHEPAAAASGVSVHVAGCGGDCTTAIATDAAAAAPPPASLQPALTSAGDCASGTAQVVFTNQASIPSAVLQQIAAAASWSKEQLKMLQCSSATKSAGAKGAGMKPAVYVGVELHCSSEHMKQQLMKSAHDAGALTSSSCTAAQLLRNHGVDG